MYNRVVLVGNLTRDPELRYLPSGSSVCNTAIATSRKFKKNDGSPSEEVCFIDIAFFGRTGEIANQYLKKGSKVLVEGRLKLEQWTDQNGGKRSKHSVTVDSMQMLDSKGGDSGGGFNPQPQNDSYAQASYQPAPQQQAPAPQPSTPSIPEVDIDDEIPF